jgi:predicted PurR-regulated permease PerM
LFISEIQQFSQLLPQYFEKISPPLRKLGIQAVEDIETFVALLRIILEKMTANILNILFLIFGGIFASIFILANAVFLSLEEKGIERTLILLFPQKYDSYVLPLLKRCQKRVSSWFLTRVLSCVFVGVVTYIALLIFKTPYPFSFGLIAGVLNFIPIVGPMITGILLFVIISLGSMFKAVFVLIVFTLIQQIEGSILIPILSRKLIGLSPVLVLLSLAIGGALWGFLGAVLAVPLAGILVEFLKDFLKKKKEEDVLVL